jgi:hypothetical protein
MTSIGMIAPEEMSESTKKILAEKKTEFEARQVDSSSLAADDEPSAFPENASLCKKCSTKAVIVMDGCATCLNCGDSKCG